MECAKLLLAANADINFTNKLGDSALYLAAREGHADVVNELLQHPEVRIDAKYRDGWTALHLSARGKNDRIVTNLIMKGANTKLKNNDNETAQDVAGNDEFYFILNVC